MDNKQDLIIDIQSTIRDFLADLECVFNKPKEKRDISLIQLGFRQLHPLYIVDRINKYLLRHKEIIQNKNLYFFDENIFIFGMLGEDNVNYYRDEIINNNRLSTDNLNTIWNYLEVIIDLVETYNNLEV